MKVLRSIADVPADWPASAVSIGKFDGVHAGHRAVIGELKALAATDHLVAVVITFDRHPLAVLSPEKRPPELVSTEQKLELLAETGLDATLVLSFDKALSTLSPQEFVAKVLVGKLHARHVMVGRDFRFGAGGEGDRDLLGALGESHGFAVHLVEDVKPDGTRRASSTWIRQLLLAGDVRSATKLLEHLPTVRGEVVHGAKRGRELGFPTANLSPQSEGLIPADGVYAGWLFDGDVRYPAAISVGNNPTFEGVARKQVEAYVMDHDHDLDFYDHVVSVAFVERIRGMVAYNGVEPLIAQMHDDVARARKILA